MDFDITADRGKTRNLTFGAGFHYCVGANIAKAELEEGLTFLAGKIETPRAGRRSRSSRRSAGSTASIHCRSVSNPPERSEPFRVVAGSG